MKLTRTFGLVLFGIAALSCAVLFAQTSETAKQPSITTGQPNPLVDYISQDVLQDGQWARSALNYHQESSQLAKRYVKAEKEDEKKEIRKKLGDVLAKQFDAQVVKQQKELTDLENQIASLKALLKKRTDAKTTIIDRRMDQLIQDAEGLGWTAPGAGHSGYGFDANVVYPQARKH